MLYSCVVTQSVGQVEVSNTYLIFICSVEVNIIESRNVISVTSLFLTYVIVRSGNDIAVTSLEAATESAFFLLDRSAGS